MITLLGVLITLMASIAGFGYNQMQRISTELHGIVEKDIPLTEITTEISSKQMEGALLLEKSFRQLGLGAVNNSNDIARYLSQFSSLSQQIDTRLQQAGSILNNVASSNTNNSLKNEITSLQTALNNLELKHRDYESLAGNLIDLIESQQLEIAETKLSQLELLQDSLNHQLETFLVNIENLTKHALIQTEQHEKTAVTGMVIIGLIGIVLGILMGGLCTITLTRSLRRAVEASDQMAQGDLMLSLQTDAKDEAGTLLNAMDSMARKLERTIGQVLVSSNQIASVAEEMAAASEQTNQAVSSQQLNTEHVVSSMTEMATTIQQIAASAVNTATATNNASDQAELGTQVVTSNQTDIDQLVVQIQDAATQVQSVNAESNAISEFVTSINEIAEQTNLLALNAAIEAARAGDQGRGFAVVAEEVRNLAQRTQGATSEIHRLIDELQSKTSIAVNVIERSREMVDTSALNADKASESLRSINHSIQQINGMTMEIAAICEQQSASAEEINQSVISISHSGNEVLGSSAHTAHSSEELALLAADLRNLMQQFKVNTPAASM